MCQFAAVLGGGRGEAWSARGGTVQLFGLRTCCLCVEWSVVFHVEGAEDTYKIPKRIEAAVAIGRSENLNHD